MQENFLTAIKKCEVPAFAFTKKQLEYIYSNGESPMTPDLRRHYENNAICQSSQKPLKTALKETGYKHLDKNYTRRQVELFFDAVGSPVLTERNIDFLVVLKYLSENQAEHIKILYSQLDLF